MFNMSNYTYDKEKKQLVIQPITFNSSKRPYIESNTPPNIPQSPIYFLRCPYKMPKAERGKGKETYIQPNLIYFTKEGDRYLAVEYYDPNHVLIWFPDYNYYKIVETNCITRGAIRNPYHLDIYGGYYGEGKFGIIPHSNEYLRHIYHTWRGILRRCSQVHAEKMGWNWYMDTLVCDEWRNFQNFATWYDNIYKQLNPNIYYVIDKDIRQIGIHPKVYSPNTCCIVPEAINLKLDGIYKCDKRCNGLPIGVNLNPNSGSINKYRARIIKENSHSTGAFSQDPMISFQAYKKSKLEDIVRTANYYFSINALSLDDYNYLIHNFDILPYNN